MSIVIKDLKKNEELDRQAVMRFCRGGKKHLSGIPNRKTAIDTIKERLLKASQLQSDVSESIPRTDQ
ncbi:MAG: hypothetical protein V3V31_03735 [Methylococcales bacterium]